MKCRQVSPRVDGIGKYGDVGRDALGMVIVGTHAHARPLHALLGHARPELAKHDKNAKHEHKPDLSTHRI